MQSIIIFLRGSSVLCRFGFWVCPCICLQFREFWRFAHPPSGSFMFSILISSFSRIGHSGCDWRIVCFTASLFTHEHVVGCCVCMCISRSVWPWSLPGFHIGFSNIFRQLFANPAIWCVCVLFRFSARSAYVSVDRIGAFCKRILRPPHGVCFAKYCFSRCTHVFPVVCNLYCAAFHCVLYM